MSTSQLRDGASLDDRSILSKRFVPHELEIALNGPIGPQRLREDTVVINENGWFRFLTPSSTVLLYNEIVFSNLSERDTDREIAEILAEYHNRNLPVTWCVYPWTLPGNLGERLLALGAKESVIVTFLGDTALPLQMVEGADVTLVDPESKDDFEAYMAALIEFNKFSADEAAFRRRHYYELSTGPKPAMQLLVGRYKGAVAGCSATMIKEDSGHMTGAYVFPAFQAHGFFQSFIAASLKFLREAGIKVASGHGNEKSAPWVTRFGFRPIFQYKMYDLYPPSIGG